MKTFGVTAMAILLLAACSTHTTYSHHKKTEPSSTAVARTTDPVCGMAVSADSSRPVRYEGTDYYFCCAGCRQAFEQDPDAYLKKETRC